MMAVASLIREQGMRFWRTTGSKTNGSSRVIPTRKRQQEGKQARGHGASSGRRADRHLLHQRGVFTVSGKDFAQILEPALPEPGRVSVSGRDRKGGGGWRRLLDGRRCFVVNYVQWSPEFDRFCGDASRQGASTAILSSSRAFPTCFWQAI